ncbi:DUF3090 domain-containing protein [Nocardioides sp. Bht2]|uniref:DUF3090 domain-containing protein n=1 Tax=Nocardioides sp. Bht2 TaxID=3392297 RepID=UPI0039B40156
MASVVHLFDPPDRFIVGTVGEPGQRAFFLQARSARRLVTVAIEKQQVELLAQRLDNMLDNLMNDEGTKSLIPAVAPVLLEDNGPLEQPIEVEFRVGTMTLSWDTRDDQVIIEVFPHDPDFDPEAELEDDLDGEADEVFLVRFAPGAARAFVKRAETVVGAGRDTCPFCGGPIDPSGHLCVRANGFRRRDP